MSTHTPGPILATLDRCTNETAVTKHALRTACSDASYIIRDLLKTAKAAVESGVLIAAGEEAVSCAALDALRAAIAKAEGRS